MFWFARFFPAFNDCLCCARKKPGNEIGRYSVSTNQKAPFNIYILNIGNEVGSYIKTKLFGKGEGREQQMVHIPGGVFRTRYKVP